MMAFALGCSVMGHTNDTRASDIEAGQKVFKKCKACHVVDQEKNKTGPHLVKIIGRPAAVVESYKKYSDALKDSGIVWDEKTLDGYLKNPREYLKGTNMVFAGLKREDDRSNLIAYLKSLQ
jgi:cytochrome c